MTSIKIWLVAAFFCAATAVSANTKLLSLGDSRVAGEENRYHHTWRYPLWAGLNAAGCAVDFIGPLEGPDYPNINGIEFDDDHASFGGFTTIDVLETLEIALESGTPDLVILSIGGNDLLEGEPVDDILFRLAQIIDLIRDENSNVTIFLEQIPPGIPSVMRGGQQARFEAFNTGVADVASVKDTSRSRVIAIDMLPGWDGNTMLSDDVHYTLKGASFVAANYEKAIVNELGNC